MQQSTTVTSRTFRSFPTEPRSPLNTKLSYTQALETTILLSVSITLMILCRCLIAKPCPTLLGPHGLQPARLLCPWDFQGKKTGVGWHFLLQGVRGFPDPGVGPTSPSLQADSLLLNHLARRDYSGYLT